MLRLWQSEKNGCQAASHCRQVAECGSAGTQVRNASPEDVNRSSLGRMAGGVALLWLASYAIGIPFKYGLAGALLAISALLFAEWDQGDRARRARGRTGTTGTTVSPREAHSSDPCSRIVCLELPGNLPGHSVELSLSNALTEQE